MRLLSLDFDPVYGPEATRSDFSGDLSVFDFDAVIWDPARSLGTYQRDYTNSYVQNLPCLSDHSSVQVQADVRRRRVEFVEFIDSGRVVVVIVRPPQECYVENGKRSYSGTGRNRREIREVDRFDIMSAIPLPSEARFIAASGTRIEFNGDGPIVRLLRKYANRLRYDAVFKDVPGTSLAHVAGTDRHIASVQKSKGGGYLVLIPAVDLELEYNDDEKSSLYDHGWVDDAPEFQSDLLAAIEQLAGRTVIARPAWASDYATDKQQALRETVLQQQAKVEAAREKLSKLQHDQEAAQARDQLYLGTGRALELQVKSVLELLGGKVTEPAPGRDDWKVTFPEGKGVVEVKGVTKSAAEKHAAQLEKWVATALEETGEAPKGILVANTWRETPLQERSAEDFPDQMIPYCKSRKHCLVTGLQLFVIREEIESDPARSAYWRKKLLQTSGALSGAKDWQKVIKKSERAE